MLSDLLFRLRALAHTPALEPAFRRHAVGSRDVRRRFDSSGRCCHSGQLDSGLARGESGSHRGAALRIREAQAC
jgi:hypothetical protein